MQKWYIILCLKRKNTSNQANLKKILYKTYQASVNVVSFIALGCGWIEYEIIWTLAFDWRCLIVLAKMISGNEDMYKIC